MIKAHKIRLRPTPEQVQQIVDFETKIFFKEAAPELFREFLARDAWQPEPVALSGVTDPYQPIERKLRLTHRCLEVAAESEVYEALSRLISHGLVASAPTVLHLARWVEGTRPGARAEGARHMQAYVLIKLLRGKARDVHPLLGAVALIFAIYFIWGIR